MIDSIIHILAAGLLKKYQRDELNSQSFYSLDTHKRKMDQLNVKNISDAFYPLAGRLGLSFLIFIGVLIFYTYKKFIL